MEIFLPTFTNGENKTQRGSRLPSSLVKDQLCTLILLISSVSFLTPFLWVSVLCHTDKGDRARGSSGMRPLTTWQFVPLSPSFQAICSHKSRTVQTLMCSFIPYLMPSLLEEHQAHSTQGQTFPSGQSEEGQHDTPCSNSPRTAGLWPPLGRSNCSPSWVPIRISSIAW